MTKAKQKSKQCKTNAKFDTNFKMPNANVQKVKGEQNSDKHEKNEKAKSKSLSKHKACKQKGKHSESEMKQSQYLFACGDNGAVKYFKVDNDNVSSVDGPGILAYSACC